MVSSSNFQQLRILNICSTSNQPGLDSSCREENGFSPAQIFMAGLDTKESSTKFSPAWSFAISPLFLYDTRGLGIFDDITHISQYYLSGAERTVLIQYANRIASLIPNNARIVELGAGSMAKTAVLLEEIMKNFRGRRGQSKGSSSTGSTIGEDVVFPIYQPVDICASSLELSLHELSSVVPEMQLEGLCGSYHDAVNYLNHENLNAVKNNTPRRPLVILWLGSSIGNMKREEAAGFINFFRRSVFKPGDLWITGIDGRNWSAERAWKAYNDKQGVTKEFILNGLVNINRILVKSLHNGHDKLTDSGTYRTSPFPVDKFKYIGIYNEIEGRHEAYLETTEDITIQFQFDPLKFDNFLFEEWISAPLSTNTVIADYSTFQGQVISKEESSSDGLIYHPTDGMVTQIKGLLSTDNAVMCVNKALKAGEKIHMEYSYKYSAEEIVQLFDQVQMSVLEHLVNPAEPYHLIVSQEMPFWFQHKQAQLKFTSEISPTLGEWEELWKAWDFVTGLIEPADLLYQPICLRHPFLFYLGHIPAFLDHHLMMHMTSDLKQSASLPERIVPRSIHTDNFLRGIDPDVDDPSRCHDHSELPNIWPSLEALNSFKSNVRNRLRALLKAADASAACPVKIPSSIRKALWMSFEHEAMHLETLLYMMTQCPPGMLKKLPIQRGFLENQLHYQKRKAYFLTIPGGLVSLGRSRDNHRTREDECNDWGWDNEYPKVQVAVQSFRMQLSNVTVGDYVNFLRILQSTKDPFLQDLIPVSWIRIVGDKDNLQFNLDDYAVRTIFGPVILRETFSWPVHVNGLQAARYAAHEGCRLPTEAEWVLAKGMSAPESGWVHQQILEARNFRPNKVVSVQHYSKNIGFKNWCQSNINSSSYPSTGNTFVEAESEIFDMVGSGWEWTCTKFGPLTDHLLADEKYEEGFIQQEGYPDYSSDFFDGKHWVLLGGSWATHPRLSDRSTFRNWYQPGYGYVFATFRCVQDIVLNEEPNFPCAIP